LSIFEKSGAGASAAPGAHQGSGAAAVSTPPSGAYFMAAVNVRVLTGSETAPCHSEPDQNVCSMRVYLHLQGPRRQLVLAVPQQRLLRRLAALRTMRRAQRPPRPAATRT
jgi:hypothetical protein